MEYGVVAGITFLISWIFIYIISKTSLLYKDSVMLTQLDLHKILKRFFYFDSSEYDVGSQSKNRRESSSIKVIIIQDKAYWVDENVFYVSEIENGIPIPETAMPVDTTNMSKEEIDKMMFILDNLGKGETQ